jgi:hypothetical protein
MPNITEAHVVLLKQPHAQTDAVNADEDFTPWENFLAKARNIRPQRFQVHLVVAGFGEREEARQFAENFMAHGSIFVFNQKRRPLYRLEVEDNQAGEKNDQA